VFEYCLGIFLRNLLAVAPRVLHLFDLLDGLELDEQDDWVDLVVVQPFHRLQMDVQNAMLVLDNNGIRS